MYHARLNPAVANDPFQRVFGADKDRSGPADRARAAIDQIEADTLFLANDDIAGADPEWSRYYVETLVDYVIGSSVPPGVVSDAQAGWLRTRICEGGRLRSRNDLDLLVRVIESAVSVPVTLARLVYHEIEQAVTIGKGVTRPGTGLLPGSIGAGEVALLERTVFAAATRSGDMIDAEAAAALSRIKDATLAGNNAAEWVGLYLEGVGGYLAGFDALADESGERTAELEHFISHCAPRIGNFLALALATDAGAGEPAGAGADLPDPLERELLELLYGASLSPAQRMAFDEIWERGRRFYLRAL